MHKRGHLRQLGRDSIVYGLAMLGSSMVGVAVLPILGRIFPPEDLAIVELASIFLLFSTMIMAGNTGGAVAIHYARLRSEGQSHDAMLAGAAGLRVWGGGLITAICIVLSPWINDFAFDGTLPWWALPALFLGAWLRQIQVLMETVLRQSYRSARFAIMQLLRILVNRIALIGLFYLVLPSVHVFFLAILAEGVLLLPVGLRFTRNLLARPRLDLAWTRKLLAFGLPLLPSSVMVFAMNYADRIFILRYDSDASLGIYGMGARLSNIVQIVTLSFQKAWSPIGLELMHSEDGPRIFRFISRLFLGGTAAMAVLLTGISPWVVRWMLPSDYHDSYVMAGLLAWPLILFALYGVVHAGIWKAEKTWWSMILTVAAGLVNIALNALLTPPFGRIGAAGATIIAFALWALSTMLVTERFWKVRFPLALLAAQFALGMGTTCYVLYRYSQGASWIEGMGLSVLCAGILIATCIDRTQLSILWSRLRAGPRKTTPDTEPLCSVDASTPDSEGT